jgi:hypothetical protein
MRRLRRWWRVRTGLRTRVYSHAVGGQIDEPVRKVNFSLILLIIIPDDMHARFAVEAYDMRGVPPSVCEDADDLVHKVNFSLILLIIIHDDMHARFAVEAYDMRVVPPSVCEDADRNVNDSLHRVNTLTAEQGLTELLAWRRPASLASGRRWEVDDGVWMLFHVFQVHVHGIVHGVFGVHDVWIIKLVLV